VNVLLTGGTGYIASHAAVVLMQMGCHVVLYDNLSNSSDGVLTKLTQITNTHIPFVHGDVRDTPLLSATLSKHNIDAVIHFAGLKAVGESVEKPVDYYANNVQGTISLLQAMHAHNLKTLVFSSSATVYGQPQYLPLDENHPTHAALLCWGLLGTRLILGFSGPAGTYLVNNHANQNMSLLSSFGVVL
jgi:UDP-glucose 4-epimerase